MQHRVTDKDVAEDAAARGAENGAAAVPEAELAPALADLAPDYEVLGELGRGGMAIVYRARERALGREVAIKLIRSRWADDRETIARFEREARLAARLEHPNIVRIYTIRRLADASLALVMQYVPGFTLKEEVLRRGPLPIRRVDRLIREIGSALACAHANGVIHRDVKTDNIFIDERHGGALLADFGVARPLASDAQLTVGGMAMGTPSYMSPEQIDGGPIDERSDLYSLGLVAWEMLAGEAPWEGESFYSVLHKQKTEHLAPLRRLRPDAPARLRAAVEGALRKKPADRWSSVEEFLDRLDRDFEPRWRGWARTAAERLRALSSPHAMASSTDAAIDPELAGETVFFRRAPVEPPPTEVEGDGSEAAGAPEVVVERADAEAAPEPEPLAAAEAAAEVEPEMEAGAVAEPEPAPMANEQSRLQEWLELREMLDRRTLHHAGPHSHPRWRLYPNGPHDCRKLVAWAEVESEVAELLMETYGAVDALLEDEPQGVERRTGGAVPAETAERILCWLRLSGNGVGAGSLEVRGGW